MESAADLRRFEDQYNQTRTTNARVQRTMAMEQRARDVAASVGSRFDQTRLETLRAAMHAEAERGGTKHLALRVPCGICTDGGRMINSGQPGWPATLRGEAADLYRFWQMELKPQGFHLWAEILDFPNGMPGDVGLTLSWH
jgi:hypothetical protein